MPPPSVGVNETLLVASFDGSARVKRKGGAYSAIMEPAGMDDCGCSFRVYPDLTVNEAEYRGLLLSFDLLADQARGRMIICGDSNLVIRQMRG